MLSPTLTRDIDRAIATDPALAAEVGRAVWAAVRAHRPPVPASPAAPAPARPAPPPEGCEINPYSWISAVVAHAQRTPWPATEPQRRVLAAIAVAGAETGTATITMPGLAKHMGTSQHVVWRAFNLARRAGLLRRQAYGQWVLTAPAAEPEPGPDLYALPTPVPFDPDAWVTRACRWTTSEGQRQALAALAHDAAASGVAAVKLDDLAARLGISYATVYRAVDKAKRAGLITNAGRGRWVLTLPPDGAR